MMLLVGSSPTPPSPFSRVLELQWDFKHFFPISAGESSGCALSDSDTELCLWSTLENTPKFPLLLNLLYLFPLDSVSEVMELILRAGAPWVSGASLHVFSLETSERCLIEILSLPELF